MPEEIDELTQSLATALNLDKGEVEPKPKQEPIRINFKNARSLRQESNNNKVFNSITYNQKDNFRKNINTNELDRTLKYLQLDFDSFWEKCRKDHLFAKLVSASLSKLASRQGAVDEKLQIETVGFVGEKLGVKITKLNNNGIRPFKNSSDLITPDKIKKKEVKKDECLKSFDGEISGDKLKGFISAKVALGGGGHQDNVFEEQDRFAEWWEKYKRESSEILVLLIDTDLEGKFEAINVKYKNVENILVVDHFQFQKYLIDKYSS